MDYEQIKYHLKNADSLKLLRRDNAPLIISFLYQQFKQNQCLSIPQSKLRAELTDYLEFIGEEIDPEKTYPLNNQNSHGEGLQAGFRLHRLEVYNWGGFK